MNGLEEPVERRVGRQKSFLRSEDLGRHRKHSDVRADQHQAQRIGQRVHVERVRGSREVDGSGPGSSSAEANSPTASVAIPG